MRAWELNEQETGLDRVWLDHSRFGKETVGEFFVRHNIMVDNNVVILYHGRPKTANYDVLRSGSYITDDKESALFFAARDRELSPDEVEILTLYLTPDQIQPGMHMTLIGDYELKKDKNMTEKEMLKDYKEYGEYGGWISDKNEIFGTDDKHSHEAVLYDHDLNSVIEAFQAGWVRIIWQDHGWSLEGTPKDVKRSFRKISTRFFSDADASPNAFTLHVDLIPNPLHRYIDNTNEYFIMPQEKIRLIQFMNEL